MNRVALLIGGNQSLRRSRPEGATCLSRRALIEQATVLIQERIGTVVLASAIYETEPWGEFDVRSEEELGVRSFFNRALVVETELSAHEVLHEALVIEKELGRHRNLSTQHSANPTLNTKHSTLNTKLYHSRPMDIDLIFFNEEIIDTPDLQIPHPRAHLRRFVLEPLAEIMPEYRHPVFGLTVAELLDRL